MDPSRLQGLLDDCNHNMMRGATPSSSGGSPALNFSPGYRWRARIAPVEHFSVQYHALSIELYPCHSSSALIHLNRPPLEGTARCCSLSLGESTTAVS